MNLKEFQDRFQRAILAGDDAILADIPDGPHETKQKLLSIYQDAYALRLMAFLGRRILLENVSTYVQFGQSEMYEWEFISVLARRTGCWLLFDVNNVFVSAFNHGYDAMTFLNGIPQDRVIQFHLAGHSDMTSYVVDTHDHPVREEVWALYEAALRRFGPVSTMIERDDNIPPLAEMMDELDYARGVANKVLGAPAASGAERLSA